MEDPRDYDWTEVANLADFSKPDWTKHILEGLNPGGPAEQKTVADLLEKHFEHSLLRLRALEQSLQTRFIEKDEIIEMVIVSAIAHQPLLLVGKPGTAKSKIILKFCEGLGLGRVGEKEKEQKPGQPDAMRPGLASGNGQASHHTVFQYLLNAFTEPDEVLGPVDIEGLRAKPPQFVRFRKGSITEAEVIFMDEVFRANSAILNALLSVINERQVYEGGQLHEAKARLIYGASNSTPTARQLEDLRAFYARFILRLESTFVSLEIDPQSGPTPARRQLIEQGWQNEVRELRAGYRPEGSAMEPQACLNDVLLLNRAMTELWGGPDLSQMGHFLDQYHKLVATLAGGQSPLCEIDDRKFVRLLAVLRAHALYKDAGPPKKSDLTVLRHIWDDLDSKNSVQSEVDNFLDRHH